MVQNLVYGKDTAMGLFSKVCSGYTPRVGFWNWVLNKKNFEMDKLVEKCSGDADVFYVRGLLIASPTGDGISRTADSMEDDHGELEFPNGGLLRCIAMGKEGELQGWSSRFFSVYSNQDSQKEIRMRMRGLSANIASKYGKVAVADFSNLYEKKFIECYTPREQDFSFELRVAFQGK